MLIHLPANKTNKCKGFDRPFSRYQKAPSMCPARAFQWHGLKNPVSDDAGVFAYRGKDGTVHELTSSFFLKTINEWLAKDGRPKLDDHSSDRRSNDAPRSGQEHPRASTPRRLGVGVCSSVHPRHSPSTRRDLREHRRQRPPPPSDRRMRSSSFRRFFSCHASPCLTSGAHLAIFQADRQDRIGIPQRKDARRRRVDAVPCFHITNFTNFFVVTAWEIGGRAAAAWRSVITRCWSEQQPLKQHPPGFAPTASILSPARAYRSNGGQ